MHPTLCSLQCGVNSCVHSVLMGLGQPRHHSKTLHDLISPFFKYSGWEQLDSVTKGPWLWQVHSTSGKCFHVIFSIPKIIEYSPFNGVSKTMIGSAHLGGEKWNVDLHQTKFEIIIKKQHFFLIQLICFTTFVKTSDLQKVPTDSILSYYELIKTKVYTNNLLLKTNEKYNHY